MHKTPKHHKTELLNDMIKKGGPASRLANSGSAAVILGPITLGEPALVDL